MKSKRKEQRCPKQVNHCGIWSVCEAIPETNTDKNCYNGSSVHPIHSIFWFSTKQNNLSKSKSTAADDMVLIIINMRSGVSCFFSIYSSYAIAEQHYCKTRYSQIGSSMVEVLVSLFVLAVGLFGVLSLQINALNSAQRALFISDAQVLAANMADHILSHGTLGGGATDGSFVANTITNDYKTVECLIACNETQQIDYVHAEWQKALKTHLPSGVGTVTWDSNHSVYTITIMWDQERRGVTGTSCSGPPASDLTCFVIQIKR
jgi:type IV pilus assembly protein PilV